MVQVPNASAERLTSTTSSLLVDDVTEGSILVCLRRRTNMKYVLHEMRSQAAALVPGALMVNWKESR